MDLEGVKPVRLSDGVVVTIEVVNRLRSADVVVAPVALCECHARNHAPNEAHQWQDSLNALLDAVRFGLPNHLVFSRFPLVAGTSYCRYFARAHHHPLRFIAA